MTENLVLKQIERMEDLRYTAMLNKDFNTLDRVLHDRMLHVHSTGNQHTKAEYLKGLRDGDFTYRTIERSKQQIIFQGTTALVFNHLHLRLVLMGKQVELLNRALTVYILEGESWRMLAMQSTMEPAASLK